MALRIVVATADRMGATGTHLETDASAPNAGLAVFSVPKRLTAFALALMEALNALAPSAPPSPADGAPEVEW